MNDLRNCYDQLRNIFKDNIEPYESVELVEKYRQYWKPTKVKVVLLAESHVFTTDADRKIKIQTISGLTGYPTEYAKFVYCLAYGEKNLTKSPVHPNRDGTPHYWKVFYSCNNDIVEKSDFVPVLKKTNYEQRIHNKIKLLKSLQKKRIWLVDSSIVALYNNGKKPSNKIMSSVIHASWKGYTEKVIKENNPEHVIVIGKGVAKVIERDLKRLVGDNNYKVISQPNARLSSEEHLANFKEYYRLCSQ
jgi:hypothetical protein